MARPSSTARERLLATTRDLLRRQGYHATGLNQIVEESQAPKGSLYHYFPGGKEELAAEAVQQAAADVASQIQTAIAMTPNARETLRLMGTYIAHKLKTSSFAEACPISTVALETSAISPVLQQACADAFGSMLSLIAEALQRDGYPPDESKDLANLMVCTYLGGLLLSRTQQNTDAIESAVRTLTEVLPPPSSGEQR